MSGDARAKAARKNGFDGSTSEQISSWVVELLLVPVFYSLLFTSVYPSHPAEAIAAGTAYSALLVVMIVLWLWLELTDPAAPGGCACPCFRADRHWNSTACEWQPTSRTGRVSPDFEIKAGTKVTNQRVVRYDAATKKRIRGLDHFCKWLNTPVGFRNYPHFFTLVVLCNVQVVYTLGISIVALAAWGADAFIWAWVLWILNGAGCCVLIYFGFDLMFYHFYLMRRGISTYDDIFEKAQRRTQARKRQAAERKDRAAAAAAASGGNTAASAAAAAAAASARSGEAGTPESEQLLGKQSETDDDAV